MKSIITIMKKELMRVLSDFKLIFTTILLPGLLIFIMYFIMGNIMNKQVVAPGEFDVHVHVENSVHADIKAIMAEIDQANDDKSFYVITYFEATSETLDAVAKELLSKKENPAHVVIANTTRENPSGKTDVDLKVYYDQRENKSILGKNLVEAIIVNQLIYETSPYNVLFFDDSVTEDKSIAADLIPMLVISFLFSGVMSLVPESIAGDKERGTLATLLVTPTKRRNVAIGKIVSLSVLSILAAISSFIGIILSLPFLYGEKEVAISFGGYVTILAILVSSVFLIVSVFAVLSAYAKNVKEANALTSPFLFVSMGLGLITMFSTVSNSLLYVIPIYNSIGLLKSALDPSVGLNLTNLLITIILNFVYTIILSVILARMYESEKLTMTR